MPYLLAKDITVTAAGKTTTVREYWTGHQGENGGPQRTMFKCDAKHFSSAISARECADTHKGLRNSDQWKVVPR